MIVKLLLSLLLVKLALTVPNANEQCKIIYDSNALFCHDYVDDLCTKIVCRVSSMDTECNNITTMAAAEGTPCGVDLTCQDGKCQKKQLDETDESVVDDECLFGDGMVVNNTILEDDFLPIRQMSCPEFMVYALNNDKSPFIYCENPKFRSVCCETCKIYDKFECRDKNLVSCRGVANVCNQVTPVSEALLIDGKPVEETCARTCGTCKEPKLKCSSNLCQNDARCIDDFIVNEKSLIGFKCECKEGFSGQFCELKNPCEPNPCQNEGTCYMRGPNSFGCICPKGFVGSECTEKMSDEKVALDGINLSAGCGVYSPCQNGGACFEAPDGLSCGCPPLYTGSYCDQFMNPCAGQSPCYNGGVCQVNYNSAPYFSCLCPSGCSGSKCQISTTTMPTTTTNNPCLPNPCYNGGFCYSSGNQYQCNCLPGFYGTNCLTTTTTRQTIVTTAPNVCSSNPCLNAGICFPFGNQYQCNCQPENFGENCQFFITTTPATTQTTSDPCFPNPCRNGGLCFPFGFPYQCKCPKDFFGPTCEIFTTSIPTTTMTTPSRCVPNPCQNGGICYPYEDSFQCQCPIGFFGSTCIITTTVSSTVRTTPGNPCFPNPCNNGTCTPYGTDFYCTCEPLYTGVCCDVFLNPCYFRGYPVCRNGGVCTVNPLRYPFYSCTCSPEFLGPNCQICSTTVTPRTTTVTVNPCLPNPCFNGGICYPFGTRYQCQCPIGFFGTNCEMRTTNRPTTVTPPFDACAPNPCQSGGLCFTVGNTFQCTCPYGYSGQICQIRTTVTRTTTVTTPSPCRPNPCYNRGICYPAGDLYQCICPPGFYGINCEFAATTNIITTVTTNMCLPNPCTNGGLCYQFGGTFVCNCPEGYYGQTCEFRQTSTIPTTMVTSDPCNPNPCKNGAQCRPSPFPYLGCRYVCVCCNGFTGQTCARRINTPYNGSKRDALGSAKEDNVECKDKEEKFCSWVKSKNYCNAIYNSYCPKSCNVC